MSNLKAQQGQGILREKWTDVIVGAITVTIEFYGQTSDIFFKIFQITINIQNLIISVHQVRKNKSMTVNSPIFNYKIFLYDHFFSRLISYFKSLFPKILHLVFHFVSLCFPFVPSTCAVPVIFNWDCLVSSHKHTTQG